MKKTYKIYKIDTINVDVEHYRGDYGYGSTQIPPTVLRGVYQDGWDKKDTFDSLEEAEIYLQNNLIKEYGDSYTILIEYSYD